ncbi:hypothetical protein FQR65_LT16996 [Abscondita terminalis]|nr:hypothetical protein FQR65_LT16996 [Abscondita terminalis]
MKKIAIAGDHAGFEYKEIIIKHLEDPKDAKDFDDALSLRKLENGNIEVGVHIADVSYYVQPGTLLDQEAYDRATSIYLVDRVVPMLPEVLRLGIMLSLVFIGPIFFLLIETSFTRGPRHALALDLGVILADITCIVAAYYSSHDYQKNNERNYLPEKTKKGSPIAVITPAGAIEQGQLDKTLELIKSKGFEAVLGPNVYAKYSNGYNYGGTPEERLKDLQWALDGDFGSHMDYTWRIWMCTASATY